MQATSHVRSIDSDPNRRGNITVLSALMLVVVFAMAAFAIDVGYITHIDTELQRTADACAMAAIQHLPNQTEATRAAQLLATQNKAVEGPELTVSDIVFGSWDRDTASFSPSESDPNAVRVTVQRAAARGNPLRLFFAPLIGTSHADVTATSTCMYDQNLCGPLIGIQWVSVPGAPQTDSYRSSDGTYSAQTPRQEGSLCSDGPIGLEGSAIVRGNANAGRGHSTTSTGSSMVTGSRSPRLRPLNLPGVDASPYRTNNNNTSLPGILKGRSLVSPVDANGNFLVDGGNTYSMSAGTYYFNSLTLTGQSTLQVDGPVDIYLTGNLDTSGGLLINHTGDASNLRIFMQGSSTSTALVTASVDLYAVVYAPDTALELRGGANYFGAAVGKTLLVTGNTGTHYDEDLKLSDKLNLPRRVALVQ